MQYPSLMVIPLRLKAMHRSPAHSSNLSWISFRPVLLLYSTLTAFLNGQSAVGSAWCLLCFPIEELPPIIDYCFGQILFLGEGGQNVAVH
jgi:hypothetical protein